MVKDFRFTITLADVKNGTKRADVKAKLESLTSSFAPKFCKSVRVSRFNPGNEARKGRVMQKMATDVIINVVSDKGKDK
jgi:hypothetical protein